MIGCLRGKIVKIASDYLLLDVMGVGYKLFCAKHLLQNCIIGEDKFFYIETAVGDDYIKLYGFESEAAQNWFLTLGLVQGVGAKAAFAILSVSSLEEISNGILFGDRNVFTKASGVGPKLAERIVNELKSKKNLPPIFDEGDAIAFEPIETAIHSPAPAVTQEKKPQKTDPNIEKRKIIEGAASALTNLGYQRSDAMQALLAVCEDKDTIQEGEAIHSALQYIGKMKEMA